MSETRERYSGHLDIPSHALDSLPAQLETVLPFVLTEEDQAALNEQSADGPHATLVWLLDQILSAFPGDGEVSADDRYEPGDPTLRLRIVTGLAESNSQNDALALLAAAGATGRLEVQIEDPEGDSSQQLVLTDGVVQHHHAQTVFPTAPNAPVVLTDQARAAADALLSAYRQRDPGALTVPVRDLLAALGLHPDST